MAPTPETYPENRSDRPCLPSPSSLGRAAGGCVRFEWVEVAGFEIVPERIRSAGFESEGLQHLRLLVVVGIGLEEQGGKKSRLSRAETLEQRSLLGFG